ncbi:MAG TPA: hypothetical protein VGQ39_25105 [Pyrinomonadaceae bacterium]|jgi:hypothetical protein|nr:hypothetical protein [Pyrinomonadaceae bacterium]
MKHQLAKTLTKIALLAVLAMSMAVGSTKGQSPAFMIRVNIPFDFVVADKQLPAGEYSISRAPQYSGDSVLTISSTDGRVKLFRLTTRAETLVPKEEGTLVFHRYGDQYFLFQVWPAGASTGRALLKSHSEREIEQKAHDSAGATAKKTQMTETVNMVGGPQ